MRILIPSLIGILIYGAGYYSGRYSQLFCLSAGLIVLVALFIIISKFPLDRRKE